MKTQVSFWIKSNKKTLLQLNHLLLLHVKILLLATLDLLMAAVCIALGEDGNAKWKPKDPSDPGKGKE